MTGFKDVIGHKNLLTYIENAVIHDAVSHAYILSGDKGSGKTLLANLFAMSIQCKTPREDGEPCGSCVSCKQAVGGNNPDIIRVTHKKPSSIGVEDIRDQVNNDVMIKPYANKFKVYIIDEADLMTEQAQNALLKTIEEPPDYVVILLLTTRVEALLPTIQSRCVMLKLRHLRDTIIRRYLVDQLGVEEKKADLCVAFAQGNLGQAILLSNNAAFAEIRQEVVNLMTHIEHMNHQELYEAVKRSSEYKLSISDYLDLMTIWYRDILLYKATKNVDQVIFKDQISLLRELAKKSSYEGIEDVLEAIDKSKARLRANVNFELTMELLLLSISDMRTSMK